MRERLLSPACEAYLGPVAVAQFVEAGWLKGTPLAWSRGGQRAAFSGWGLWDGPRQRLPYPTEPSPWGAAFWEGRSTRVTEPLQGGFCA